MGTTYRSGRATALLIVGIGLLIMLGLLGGLLVPAVLLLVTGEPAILLLMLVAPIGLLVGGILTLVGHRTRVWISPSSVSWSGALGSARTVPFSAVSRIEVPTAIRGPAAVQLHLTDGSVVPVSSLKMSSSDNGYTADRGYRKTSAVLVQAHLQWQAHAHRGVPDPRGG